MVHIMSQDPLYPRGNALTEVMELTALDGERWIAYIDGLPPAPQHHLFPRTVLPGRRLRFDSATESRTCVELPAGTPFLTEWRLQRLLGGSELLGPSDSRPAETRAQRWRHRWRMAAAHGRELRARGRELTAEATHAFHLAVEGLHFGRRARP